MAFGREKRRNRRRPQDEMRTLIRKVRELAGELDRETFNRRPDEGKWSVAECIDHLNATARLYLPLLTDAIHQGRADGHMGPGSGGRTLMGRLVVWGMEPPPKRLTRMTTWTELEPGTDLDPGQTLDEFQALHEELIVRMNEAADLDLGRIRFRSALDRRLKLSLGDWFAFLAAHGRRHLWQAAQAARRANPDPGKAEDGEESAK